MLCGKRIIALCLSKAHDRDGNALISSLNEAICNINCHLFVYSTCSDLYWHDSSESGEASVYELIDYNIIDCVIIYSEKLGDKAIREKITRSAEKHGIPVIHIGSMSESGISICFDYEAGFENVARHVIEHHKVRNIHFMAGFEGNEFSERRFEALKKVMCENGLDTPDNMISYGDFWSEPTERAMEKLIAGGNIPEAIICANDVMAITVCEVLKNRGYKVPDDVIVTGMDGIDEIYFSTPKITSCECNIADISQKIAELLPDILSRKLTSGNYSMLPSVILSQSCGCSEGKDMHASKYFNFLNNRLNKFQNDEHHYSIAAIKMQTAETIEKSALEIRNAVLLNSEIACPVCVLLIDRCIDEKADLLKKVTATDFGEKLCLFYDHDSSFAAEDGFTPKPFDRKDIIPLLDEKLKDKYPLIFIAMNYLDKPLGYACFYFRDYELSSYARITQSIDFLNSAISGFINVNHQRYLNSKIERMYESDVLTKLYNRNGFVKRYEKFIETLEEDQMISIIGADLDGLKGINDNYGHGEGDNAIFTVAESLRNVLPKDALCSRFGGDELVAAVKGEVNESELKEAFGRFFDEYNKTSGKPYKVEASIGVYAAEAGTAANFETVVKEADRKMYEEKQKRKAAKKAAT